MTNRSPYTDAVRILFVLTEGSELVTPKPEGMPNGVMAVFAGEARLHALDFWMRYPDYLADELLDQYEHDPVGCAAYLAAAESIFEAEEPDLRAVPMIRYHFGAYDPIDDAVAVLQSRDLVRLTGDRRDGKVLETRFILTRLAFEFGSQIRNSFPILNWYSERAALVVRVAGRRGGGALKKHQYEQQAYASTDLRATIPSIATGVRERLAKLRANAGITSEGSRRT